MPTMPYHLEKGPTLSVLEDFLANPQRLVTAVGQLRAGAALSDIGFLNSGSLNAGPNAMLASRIAYLNEEWLGMEPDGAGGWTPQGPFGPGAATTGSWNRWYGDANGILRVTFLRAGEIALGIDHGDPLPALPLAQPPKPIQVLWKCAQPWFEGWITWQPESVTVILCTPATDAKVWTSPDPYTGKPGPAPADFARDPVVYPPAFGMVVVTHEHTQRTTVGTNTAPATHGQISHPLHVWEGQGPVIAVNTAEKDGGVLHQRRPF